MKRKRLLRVLSLSQAGSILVVCLWLIAFLVILAVGLCNISSTRLKFTSHWLDNHQAYLIARAGVRKAMAELKKESISSWYDCLNDPWSNNSPDNLFKEITLGEGSYTVSYKIGSGKSETIGYGLIDEERKININIDLERLTPMLKKLFEHLIGLTPSEAQPIANCIADWRDKASEGEPEKLREGGAEDSYYENLEAPYSCKDGPFQVLEELLLVKDITPEIFDKVRDYLTIYSTGKVNINTAPLPVLVGLGLRENLAQKIIEFRTGTDRLIGTPDDKICTDRNKIVSWVNQIEPLTQEESISLLNNCDVESHYYRINAQGIYRNKINKTINCIVKVEDQKVRIVLARIK